jgi:hypothetical protein
MKSRIHQTRTRFVPDKLGVPDNLGVPDKFGVPD